MSRIRCHYSDCIFLDEGYCGASAVEIDPEEGCVTYARAGEISTEQAWEDNENLEEEWADAGFGSSDGDDDLWLEVDNEEDIPEDIGLDGEEA